MDLNQMKHLNKDHSEAEESDYQIRRLKRVKNHIIKIVAAIVVAGVFGAIGFIFFPDSHVGKLIVGSGLVTYFLWAVIKK
jgi:hypothetical protein